MIIIIIILDLIEFYGSKIRVSELMSSKVHLPREKSPPEISYREIIPSNAWLK